MSIKAARDYIQANLPGVDIKPLSDLVIVDYIDQNYPGGWVEFKKNYAPAQASPTKSNTPSPMALRAKVQRLLGRSRFNLGPFDEVLGIKFTADEITITTRRVTFTDYARRYRLTSAVLVLESWKKSGLIWEPAGRAECADPDFEPYDVHKYGRIRTAAYLSEQREQYETCYRPGTERTPMAGPAARLEISHKEYFAGETYPKVETK